MDGIWNRYNLKSTRRIYTFGVLKCSGKFKCLDLPSYISICAPFVALETSKRNSISCHVFWIMSRVTVSMADVILYCRCWIFLIFSAYTMFLMYPYKKKSSGERSGLRGGQGIGPPLTIHASGNLSFTTSDTKQLKWGRAPSCIKINLLTISYSKVPICGNTYCLSYSGFKSRPSFSMTLYYSLWCQRFSVKTENEICHLFVFRMLRFLFIVVCFP